MDRPFLAKPVRFNFFCTFSVIYICLLCVVYMVLRWRECLGKGICAFLPYGKKVIIALRRRGSMSLARPAAGGESCKQDSFLPYRKFLRQKEIN